MRKLVLRTGKNLVPILSSSDIDRLAEYILSKYMPEALESPRAVDVDLLAERLGLTMDFQYLTNTDIFLGMMVFEDTNTLPVYDPATNRAVYISAKKGTVIIDNRLLEPHKEHRLRFTVGHELAHSLLHADYFRANPRVELDLKAVACRCDTIRACGKRQRTPVDWAEWQANTYSSSSLIPTRTLMKLITPDLVRGNHYDAAHSIFMTSEVYNVSPEAARIRIEKLGVYEGVDKKRIQENYRTFFA